MQMLSDLLALAVTYPSRTLGVLITVVGAIDYVCGNEPGSVTDKYIGLTRRILHQIKQAIGRKKK